LAEKAFKLAPEPIYLNTLGVAQYRNGKYAQSLASLEQSHKQSQGAYAAFDLFFLAMCHHQLGDEAKARACFERGNRWLNEQRGRLSTTWRAELETFQAEAAALLQLKTQDLSRIQIEKSR
jgi:tetratricopeptide (TPR) repeat protein